MRKLIDYLISIGYSHYQIVSGKRTEVGKEYSSMGMIVSFLEKDGFVFTFGLSEYGKPPTLISPRPYFGFREVREGLYTPNIDDDSMNRAFMIYSEVEIYNSAINRTFLDIK